MSDEKSESDTLEDSLRQTHGEVFKATFVDVGGVKVDVFYRCPTRQESERFKYKAFDDKKPKKQADGADELGMAVVVHPDRKTFAALCERRPMIAGLIAGDAAQIAAGKESELGKRV